MIPKKLYIPTSTLNFNNIMSSESISPASFYAIRGYGYRSIEKVCANNFDNRILLYEYYPIYQIEDVERDNYPLVIEIDTSQLGDGVIIDGAGVYYSEQTIYLNALTTVFIFQNKEDINTALTKSQQSIETKLINLYKHNLKTIQACGATMIEWRGGHIDDINLNKDKYVENDKRIDRIKGFLYAHALGVKKSSSIEVVKLKNLSRHLYNIWSAVISSSYNVPSVNQKNELDELYGKINSLIGKIIGVDKKIADIFQRELPIEESKSKEIVNIIKKYGRYDIGIFFGIESFRFMPLPAYGVDIEEKVSALNKHILELDNFILALSQTAIKNTTDDLPEVSNLQICQYKGRSKEQSEFLINMFNTFLCESSRDFFLQDRYAFARMGGELFKNKIIDKWDGSQEKSYINSLLKNLKTHTPFNVSNVENLTLKSFAIFCQVANDDIEKLESNLTKNEIIDYKFAFGLWGIIFGFAGISKIAYNEIYDRYGNSFFIQLYKYIYAELHEVKLEGEISNHITIESKLNQHLKDNITYNLSEDDKILDTLKKGKVVKKKHNGLEIERIYEIIIEKYIKHNRKWDSAFQDMIDDKNDGITPAVVDNICSCLKLPNWQAKRKNGTKTNKTQESHSPSLFPEREFYRDIEVYNIVKDLLQGTRQIDLFKKDLSYIQEGYKSEGEFFKQGKSRTNSKVIDHLENLLWSSKKGKQEWKKEIYEYLDIDAIIKRLRNYYGD